MRRRQPPHLLQRHEPCNPASRPGGGAVLALGMALVLGAAGEAAAQVCAGALPTVHNSNLGGTRIVCRENNPSASGIRINAENVSLSVTSSNFAFRPAIDARLNSASDVNDVNVRLGRGLVISTGALREAFIGAYTRNAGSGNTFVVMEDGASITTTGGDADGIRYSNPSTATGTIDVRMTGGSITTSGNEAHGIYILHNGSGASTVDMSGGTIKVSADSSRGIHVYKQRGSGDATITFSGGSIEKSGGAGAGIGFEGDPQANAANAVIRVTGGSITTSGAGVNHGVRVAHAGTGGADVDLTDGSITTSSDRSHGVSISLSRATNPDGVSIDMSGGAISTSGMEAHGMDVRTAGSGAIRIDMSGGAISASGMGAHGMDVRTTGSGAIRIDMSGGAISASGMGSNGMNVQNSGAGDVRIAMTGGTIDASGADSAGIRIPSGQDGSTTVTVNGGVVMGGTDGALGIGAGVSIIGRGEVVVGGNARIGARSGRAIFGSGSGELVVTIVDPDGLVDTTGLPRIERRIEGRIEKMDDSLQVRLQPMGSSVRVPLLDEEGDPVDPVGSGPWDVSVVEDGAGFRVVRELSPRTRLYEALPSVLLGMNGLPRFRERMAAPRTERGGWARVEASRGEWKADASTTGVEYTHRRSDLRAGLDVPAGENGLLGVSVHHRLGSANVSRGGGIELSGSGAGVSGTWFGFDAYVDVQAETTWYEADVSSTARGTLKKDVSGRGHALGVEVGRRVAMPEVGEGVVLTPRAGLVHSKVSVDDFTDAVGARVSVDEARSLKGRVGVVVEREAEGSPNRLSGSLDVEHEFSDDMKVRMTGAELTPEAEATWVRLGLDGSHGWDGGRYTLRGGVSYATSGGSYEVGGGVSLEVRF